VKSVAGYTDQGREAFAEQAWEAAFVQLSAADARSKLDADDLELLATAAYLTGREQDSGELWSRAHTALLARGEPERAVRCAFWLGLDLLLRGQLAVGGGWLAKAERALEQCRDDCAERGYVLVPAALVRATTGGDPAGAYASFEQAMKIGERHAEPDLTCFGRLGRGQCLIRLGEIVEGLALLDEVMADVTAGGVSPMAAGIVYCAVISTCREIYDLRRAQEWTTALSAWCEGQPELVTYRGHCLVYRAEIMALHGDWSDALDEVRRARERFVSDQPAVGAVYYQLAELHRLRGDFAAAEDAYRHASRYGHPAQPGLALQRVAEGRLDAAEAGIRRVLDEMRAPALLAAYVEIAVMAGDVTAARSVADELAGAAAELDAPLLHAMAGRAEGTVRLAEGDARGALTVLRRAWTIWQEVDAPYEAGRVRVLIGQACRQLGDEDGAQMELDAARWIFDQLGATPDVARVESLARKGKAQLLTAREVQVLRLVAGGLTNRAIATQLYLSEKTVARHLSNIFTKLALPSRSAATAYAYEHGLVYTE